MFRIDVPTAVGVLPTPDDEGTPGYFSDGNPATSTPATVVPADFLNMAQEELCNLATAGGAALSKNNRTQVRDAVLQLLQRGPTNFATDSGSANDYKADFTPAIAAYTNGMVLRVFTANANSGASTLDAGAGEKDIVRADGSALAAGDIPANSFFAVQYHVSDDKFYLISTPQTISANTIQQQTGNYATAGGTANAITATFSPAVGAHVAGMPLRVKIATTNTGATTFNPGPGAVDVVNQNGGLLSGGELVAGSIATFIYNGATYVHQNGVSMWPLGTLSGLTLSRTGTTTYQVAAGAAVNENTGVKHDMVRSAAMSKSLSGWSAGGGNGSLDTGSIASNTWYHVWLIRKDSDGTTDVLLSLSATAPTMPSGYTARRRLGSIRTNGSSQITPFLQYGDAFVWETPVISVSATNPGISAVTRTLMVPTGVVVNAKVHARLNITTTNLACGGLLSPLALADIAPSNAMDTAPYNFFATANGVTGDQMNGTLLEVLTDTSAQVRSRLSTSTAAVTLNVTTLGWTDNRGRH